MTRESATFGRRRALHKARATLQSLIKVFAMLPSTEIQCPYCGEHIEILVDDSAGDQHYVEDCHVCCRPIAITLSLDESGAFVVAAHTENDA
jgi:hypothetical protein